MWVCKHRVCAWVCVCVCKVICIHAYSTMHVHFLGLRIYMYKRVNFVEVFKLMSSIKNENLANMYVHIILIIYISLHHLVLQGWTESICMHTYIYIHKENVQNKRRHRQRQRQTQRQTQRQRQRH